jgi:hypothetical protein
VKKWLDAPEIQADEAIPTPKLPRNIIPGKPTETLTVTLALASSYPTPTQYSDSISYPASDNEYTVLGCYGSNTGYDTWSAAADLPTMDNKACVASCVGHKYAGVFSTTCYCAHNLGDASPVSSGRCAIPCEGNSDETCGGLVGGMVGSSNYNKTTPYGYPTDGNGNSAAGSQLNLRPDSANVLLTVLRKIPVKAGPAAASTHVRTVTITTAVTVTYTTICATNAAELIQIEYGTTVTIEKPLTGKGSGMVTNAAAATTPWVPMTTRTETCDGCGLKGESTVTLTVPKAVLTAGPDLVVTALAVATVVPINPNGATSAQKPVKAGASRNGLGVAGVLGWGLAIWLSVFGAIAAL